MNDWKNPNFPQRDNPWATTPMFSDEMDTQSNRITLLFFLRGVLGFVLLVSINAFALFAFLTVIGYDIAYADAVIASCVYVCWRVWDVLTFSKIGKH